MNDPSANNAPDQMMVYERLLRRIALVGCLLLGFLPPILGLAARYDRLQTELLAHARTAALLIERQGFANEQLPSTLQDIRRDDLHIEVMRAGNSVFRDGPTIGLPNMTRWQDVQLGGEWVGRVSVTASTESLIRDLLLAFVLAISLPVMLLWLQERYIFRPMRAAAHARKISEERLNDLVDLSSDWFWEQDEEYRFTLNSLGSFGNTPAPDIIGMARWDLPIRLSEEIWQQHRNDLQQRRYFTLRYPIDTPIGERWFEVRGKPVFNESGLFIGYRGIGRDISSDVESQQELAKHRDHLQELVDLQLAEVIRAKQRAEAGNLAKSEFLTNITHELRTPIHGILSYARFGLTRQNLSEAKCREYFERIYQSGDRLLGLVNDLLDLSKLEAGKMPLEFMSCDTVALLRQTMDEMESLAADKQLQVELVTDLAESPVVDMDPLRIAQVVRNLLANAIRFSPPGGRICLRLADCALPVPTQPDQLEGALRISVQDQGPGIPAEEMESIFEKFVQSTHSKTGAGGTGLGLAICREIALMHRGRISAANHPEGGAILTLTLPRHHTA